MTLIGWMSEEIWKLVNEKELGYFTTERESEWVKEVRRKLLFSVFTWRWWLEWNVVVWIRWVEAFQGILRCRWFPDGDDIL